MLRHLQPEKLGTDGPALPEEIVRALKEIHKKLEEEIAFKTRTLDQSWLEIAKLRQELKKKEEVIAMLESRIADNSRSMEGNRQLINKLLNDLQRMQHDLDWYKRTYESRSLFGVIKDKLKHLFS
jgi:septal ring factor EnvC (AmiA/AmiB activator)